MKKILAIVMVAAMIAALAVTTSAVDVEEGLIAHFTFDDETDGLSGNGAVATPSAVVDNLIGEGEIVITDGALDLGASGSNFLSVTKEDGSPLLSGLEGITISYWSKNSAGTGWNFFAVPGELVNDSGITAQTYLSEKYIGVLENNADVTYERYNCTGARTISATGTAIAGEWKYVTITMDKNSYGIYIDGEWANSWDEALSDAYENHELSAILGDASRLFIGYANWESGEYSSSLVDDYRIYNYAMNEVQVAELAIECGVEGVEIPTEEPDDEEPAGDATEAPKDEGTEAPKDEGTTAAPAEGDNATTEAPAEEKGGCGSTLGAAAAVVALAGVFGCAIVKKH